MFLLFFSLILYRVFCFPFVFFLSHSSRNCPTSHHMVEACWGEDFLFYHLDHSQLALYVTLGFLHRSLTQGGLCLPKMTLLSLSLPALTCFALVHSP